MQPSNLQGYQILIGSTTQACSSIVDSISTVDWTRPRVSGAVSHSYALHVYYNIRNDGDCFLIPFHHLSCSFYRYLLIT